MIERIKSAVDKHRARILRAERDIWAMPETGYREVKTTEYMAKAFCELGYELERPSDITGFVTTIDTGREGPTLLILGELDSVICFGHPECDPETGAVHSCGHHVQSATLLGIAAALKEPGMLDGLSGKIKLCAVPAEELLEIEYRTELREKGIIKYFGGKSEFLSRGYFDDVKIAFMVHAASKYASNLGSIGCIAKSVIYKGLAAHAGGSPYRGINALYAATCGINAVNAIRETFRDNDTIRFHPIITDGGSMVNAIPERASIETYVRGHSFEAILRENKKINRALIGAALSLGANVEIIDSPGYAPLENSKEMIKLAKTAYDELFDDGEFVVRDTYSTGCTDMGDLSSIMPVIHPYSGGAEGTSHGSDYFVVNPERACLDSAKWQILMARRLLENGAALANEIIAGYQPLFGSIREFLDYQDAIMSSGDRIVYTDDGAEVKI